MERQFPRLFALFLLVPSAPWHLFNGLPLSTLAEFGALILTAPLLVSSGLRRLCARHLRLSNPALSYTCSGVLILATALKFILFSARASGGFEACYQSLSGPAIPWICEKSYENAFFRHGVTRTDRTIDFGGANWNFSFVNSLRFNFDPSVKGSVLRDRLPFAATWRGATDVWARTRGEVVYIGEGLLRVSSTARIPLPPSYGAHGQVMFDLPPGRHVLLLQYRFDDGARAQDGIPRGGRARLRLRVYDPRSGTWHVAVAADPPTGWQAAGWALDALTLAGLITFGWLYGLLMWRSARYVLLAAVAVGVLIANDPTAEVLGAIEAGDNVGVGLVLPALTAGLLVWCQRAPRPSTLLLAFLAIVWMNGCRQDLREYGFATVIYRGAGDDWLTYESFARSVMEVWSLHGGEAAFYYQPLYRYIRSAAHVLLGDGDILIALFAQSSLVWALFWLFTRMARQMPLRGPWNHLAGAAAVTVVILATSEPVSRLILIGASEPAAWIAFPFIFGWLATSRSSREWKAGTVLLGVSALTRMNHAIALGWMFLVFAARNVRRWPAVIALSVVILALFSILPGMHDWYYAGQFSWLPTEYNQPHTIPMPPARWLTIHQDREAMWQARRQVEAIGSLLPFQPNYLRPTRQASAIFDVACHGLQAVWILSVVLVVRARERAPVAAAVLLVPALYLGVHLFYQVTDYYPRGIVIGHIAFGVTACYTLRVLEARQASE